MAVTEYIGPLVGPVFADPAEWTPTRSYEALTIVLNEGNSYTARQDVPIGVQITNENYWLETGNYNAQVEQYRREVHAITPLDNKPIAQSEKALSSGGMYTYLSNRENYVTPDMFGAKGDGVTDDADAFNKAMQVSNVIYLLPNKTYRIATQLNSSNHITFFANETIYSVTFDRIVKPNILIATDKAFNDILFCDFYSILFAADSKDNDRCICNMNGLGHFYNCTFYNFKKAFSYVRSCFSGCYFENCTDCINTSDSYIDNCTFNECGTCLGLYEGENQNRISNCIFEWSNIGISLYKTDNNIINNCIFDRCGTAVQFSSHNSVQFNSCLFYRSINNHMSGNINSEKTIVSNCTFLKGHMIDDNTSKIVPDIPFSFDSNVGQFSNNFVDTPAYINYSGSKAPTNNKGIRYSSNIYKKKGKFSISNPLTITLDEIDPNDTGILNISILYYTGSTANVFNGQIGFVAANYIVNKDIGNDDIKVHLSISNNIPIITIMPSSATNDFKGNCTVTS